MLATLRRFLATWPARVFFLLLVGSFGLWGVADVVRNIGQDQSAVATVAGQKIDVTDLQDAYRRQLAQIQQMMGGSAPTPDMRQAIAGQALDRLVTQAAISQEVARLGIAAPDAAVRQAVFDIPAFHGLDGKFDRSKFTQLLSANGMTEDHFVDLMRADLGTRQLVEAVRVGATAPELLVRQLFDFQGEKRVAQLVDFPFDAAPAPPAPTDAQLQRFYDDNPDRYTTPEYRRIHAIILSAATVARDMTIPEADLQAYYTAHKAEFVAPEKRSAEVVVAQQQAVADQLALEWRADPTGWDKIQQDAKTAGASTAELDTAAEAEFPSAELGHAVFAAGPDTIAGPVQTPLGWDVIRVTQVTPGSARDFAAAREEIRTALANERAGDAVYDRANKIEDQLASGTKLEDLPADLGVAAVAGTLDAQGDTPAGQPAPIPADPAVKQALIAAAFQARPGDPPQLVQAPSPPGQPQASAAYYAVQVDQITPAARKPFADVKDAVQADWTRDQRRRAEEAAAADAMTAVNDGKTLAEAAPGRTVTTSPPVARSTPQDAPPQDGVPPQLIQPLFDLQTGKATMVETPDGFVVARLDQVQEPDPTKDPVGYAQLKDQLSHSEADDLEIAMATALRTRAAPRVNRALLAQVVQQ
jgi:peptidyl-prolyl cis-trans isomerase D